MDFGLAHFGGPSTESAESVDGWLEARTSLSGSAEVRTVTGVVMGTPAYMAPQSLMGQRADPAADQFSFCVAMFEALHGVRPFAGGSIAELLGAIRRQSLVAPSAGRSVPSHIDRCVRQGLRYSPAERHESLNALLTALTATAWSPGRRRVWIAAAAGATLLGTAAAAQRPPAGPVICQADGGVSASWNERRRGTVASAFNNAELPYAPQAWRTTESALDRYAEDWQHARDAACRLSSDRPVDSDTRWVCLRRAQTRFEATLAELEAGGSGAVERADALLEGLPRPGRCVDTEPGDDAVAVALDQAPRVAELEFELATAIAAFSTGRYDVARPHLRRAEKLAQVVDYEPSEVEVLHLRGLLALEDGEYERAEDTLLESVTRSSALRDRNLMLRSTIVLAQLYAEVLGRPEAGMRYLELSTELAGQVDEPVESVEHARGHLAMVAGDYTTADEALARARAKLQAGGTAAEPKLQAVLTMQSRLFRVMGRDKRAVDTAHEAVALGETVFGRSHPKTLIALNNLATALYQSGEVDAAAEQFAEVIELREQTVGPNHQETLIAKNNLAVLMRNRGDHERSAQLHREVLQGRIETLGEGHPLVSQSRGNLAGAVRGLGRLDEAEALLREAIDGYVAVLGPGHSEVSKVQARLATLLSQRGRFGEARQLLEQALPAAVEAFGPKHRDVAFAQARSGVCLGTVWRLRGGGRPLRRGDCIPRSIPKRHCASSPGSVCARGHRHVRGLVGGQETRSAAASVGVVVVGVRCGASLARSESIDSPDVPNQLVIGRSQVVPPHGRIRALVRCREFAPVRQNVRSLASSSRRETASRLPLRADLRRDHASGRPRGDRIHGILAGCCHPGTTLA